jgi:hypothetical protein
MDENSSGNPEVVQYSDVPKDIPQTLLCANDYRPSLYLNFVFLDARGEDK